jgi:hypothetical protein
MTKSMSTGNSTFDRQANSPYQYFGKGNVISHVQYSNYIRAFNETECNGNIRPKGHLQNFDLKNFVAIAPRRIIEYVKFVAVDERVILYKVRHWSGNTEVIHGYVVTKCDKNDYKLMKKFYIGRTEKSRNVVDVFAEHVSSL